MNSRRYMDAVYPVRKITDLKDLLQQSVQMFPDNAAYLVKDHKLKKFVPITYAQVGRDYQALGTKLRAMGLGGKKIGVIGETSYSWILTYFAVVAGVGVIVPLDRNLPQGELLGLIERSGMSALVFSEKSRKSVDPLLEKLTAEAGDAASGSAIEYFISMEAEEDADGILALNKLIEEGKDLLDAGERDYLDQIIDPDQMSTLLFTSGTTGLAKGVMISHANIAANVYEMSKFFKIPEPGIVFSILPIHHVYEMTCDIWTTFYQGKTIAICEGLKYLQKNMQEVHPTVMLGVPLVFEKMYKGMFKQAKHRGEDEKLRRAIDLSKRLGLYKQPAVVRRMFKAVHSSFGGDIKAFVVGGAAADPFIIEEFEAMGFPMVQGYGMSENAPIIALNPDRCRKAASVGKALPGTRIRVINQDEDGIGELVVKGPSVMLGYFDNEEASQEALQDGWLHTGDLGYADADGYYYITGRSKTVIVTKGGKNIFPEEVEEIILKNELVKEVVVHGVEDDRVGNVIVTADIYPDYELLKEKQGEMSKAEIYHFYRDLIEEINESMPPYKQVKRVNIRETEFVKTTTGKIKRFGNRLSGGEIADVDEGRGEYHAIRKVEFGRAREIVRQIKESEDPHVLHRDLEPYSNMKMMLSAVVPKYAARMFCAQRFYPGGPYVQITYAQAEADAEGLGTALLNRGFDGRKIGFLGDNSYQTQISFLTIANGVGTFVSVNRHLDPAEIGRQFAHAGVTALLYDDRYTALAKEIAAAEVAKIDTLIAFGGQDEEYFAGGGRDVVREDGTLSWHALVEEGKHQVGRGDRQFIDAEVTGKDEAAIFFTSGVTGHAKAVSLRHMHIMAALLSAASMVKYNEDDVVISVIPAHNFYQFQMGVLMPIYCGAAIANVESVLSIESELSELGPTVLVAEPTLIAGLSDTVREEIAAESGFMNYETTQRIAGITRRIGLDPSRRFRKFASRALGDKMRLLVSGGSKLESEYIRFFESLGITVVQGYGMTECAAIVALNPDDPKLNSKEAAGHVLPGIRIHIAGAESGEPGEILVKGRNVMDGYVDDEEETEKALQNDWFHTGDYGYVDEDGFVHILGKVQK